MENSEKATPSVIYPMLPKENGDKVVIITPQNGVGKVLIREDTILANLQGCAGCGRGPFACGGVKKQWSALCWGKQLENNYYCLIMVLSTTFVLSFIGTILFCFTNPINDAILSNMVIRNNTLAFSFWQHPNVHPLMKVHIFNYTNWEKVKKGEEKKLHVEEVGPYVYSQEMERVNIEFNGDKLSYQERNHFTYLPNKSNGTHFDQVVVPNLPLLGAVSMSKSSELMSQLLSLYLNGQSSVNLFNMFNPMSLDHPDPFLTLPLHRFLWGYDDRLFTAARTAMQFQRSVPFEKFGLLVTKNGTVSERFTINTGENDKDKMNIIEKVDQEDHLPFWSSAECNSIDASDGSIFPPSQLDRHHSLYVFYPNLCRRLPFMYDKDIELSDGIQLLRYSMPRNVFSHPKNNSRNQCYCEIDTGTCPPEGVINVTACTMGVPAMVSFPHFYLGDEKLRQDITGLDPDGNKHDSYVDLHPTLGIALRGKSSLQINIQVQKTDSFMTLDFLPQGLILPIAWIEMSVEELPESLRSLVYHGTYSTAAVQLGLTVICIIGTLASGICLMVTYVKRKRRPCVTLKKVKTLTAPTAPTAETELTVTRTTSCTK